MPAKFFTPYTVFNIDSLKLPKSAFLVYWTLCRYRDNKAGTAYVSPGPLGLSGRQLRRILKLLQGQGLIAYLYAGKYLVNVGEGKTRRRVRASYWLELPKMGVLRFKASLALIFGPKVGYCAAGLQEDIGCRKQDACRLLRELKGLTPALWVEATVPGSRMSPPTPRILRVPGSQVSRLTTGVEKKGNPSTSKDFFAVQKYREFLLSKEDVDKAIQLYAEARLSVAFHKHGNETLADGVLFAFLHATSRAKVFGGYFWTALRRNLATGYCRLSEWKRHMDTRAEREEEDRARSAVREREEEEGAAARAVARMAAEMFPEYPETPLFIFEGTRVPRLNPERERMYREAEAVLAKGDTKHVST